MAAAPPSQPARSCRRCGNIRATPKLRGNRPCGAVARHGAKARRASRCTLRERNVLLVAAGFAPAFPARSLDDPALKAARTALEFVLRAHEPNPALAYDRH